MIKRFIVVCFPAIAFLRHSFFHFAHPPVREHHDRNAKRGQHRCNELQRIRQTETMRFAKRRKKSLIAAAAATAGL
ncbi:MAG: hypothetical protein NT105_16635 [Verrucomicrobia bacterium]|nr:hypothetical protein [Verrucomicrobiota bacterium]